MAEALTAADELFTSVPFGREITAEEVEETLAFFDDWEDRYRYIIELGQELPQMPESLKDEEHFIHGCQSQVWIEHASDPGAGALYFVVDSDALIVRGLAGIVLAALNGRSPREILDYDVEAYFDRIDLMNHISPTRGNGLRAMVGRIRQAAAEAETA